MFVLRYQEAIAKYESVMRREPNVPYYTNKANERICFCVVKVGPITYCRKS
jgi:DnaJ family protein C protein 3